MPRNSFLKAPFARHGESRDSKLEHLRKLYKDWCKETGVRASERVADKLFTKKTLVPSKNGEYPGVSSKVMKAASTRLLVRRSSFLSVS